jgi:RecA-family ATPase
VLFVPGAAHPAPARQEVFELDRLAVLLGEKPPETVEKPKLRAVVKDDGSEEQPRIRSRAMSQVKREPIRWLWEGRFALGKLSLILGAGSVGKSFLTLDLAGRVSRGEPWPDRRTEPTEAGMVLLMSSEDNPEDTIKPRLENRGADMDRIRILDGIVRPEYPDRLDTISLARDLHVLEEEIQRYPDVRLIILDALNSYLGKVDAYKDNEVRSVLDPLGAMAARCRVAIVCITHLKKSASASAIDRALGSVAFGNIVRNAWLVVRDREDRERRLMLQAKNNLSRDMGGLAFRIREPGVVHWDDGEVDRSADDALGEAQSRVRTVGNDIAEWLTAMLATGPVESKKLRELADREGFSWSTVENVRRRMPTIQPRHDGENNQWRWHLVG